MKAITISQSPKSISTLTNNMMERNKTNDRHFNFKLDGKATKGKLLQGAKREPILTDRKKTCTVINFSDGSYKNIALPLLNKWKKCQE